MESILSHFQYFMIKWLEPIQCYLMKWIKINLQKKFSTIQFVELLLLQMNSWLQQKHTHIHYKSYRKEIQEKIKYTSLLCFMNLI
ncbi:unnamed protein product [Paramecium sonneborni]|uniref:Uncharacterized protein n=1 Tax=Paramecium sonneborni TaxID=65129 RepID=A0A8S1QRG6_9CILI|nr:unnamed protein product [Paramecium sonneborni]